MSFNKVETTNLLKIPDNTQYWFVRSGSNAEYFEDFAYNNYIAIGDSNITLEKLKTIEPKYRATPDILQEKYKNIFQESFISDYNEKNKKEEIEPDERKKDIINLTRSASISAVKAYDFIEQMKIGDIILVPNNGSSLFRIGVITTDSFSHKVNHIFIPTTDDATVSSYSYADYDKKRRIAWIKEITVKDLPEKLLWIKYGHKAIFNITENAESINPLISSNYFYKDHFYTRIGVGTPKPISSTEWFNLQKVIVDAAPDIADQVFQKHKVESVGQIVIQTVSEHWDDILWICAFLFGSADANIKGREFHINGLLTNFYPSVREQKRHQKVMNEHEERSADLSEKKLEQEVRLKELEVQKKKTNYKYQNT
ncbi:hypothetical protein AAHB41_08915 [Pediococcus pentosaceus]|uniref:hypothetical protein n=1 Tax=Pediococcus pentosaceus TaxID=1255 RepID=UPI002FF234F7